MTGRAAELLIGALGDVDAVAAELRALGDVPRAARLRRALFQLRKLMLPLVEASPEHVAMKRNLARIDAKRKAKKP